MSFFIGGEQGGFLGGEQGGFIVGEQYSSGTAFVTQYKPLSGYITGDYSFNSEIIPHNPKNGFKMVFGMSGISGITGSVIFSGNSGNVFDQVGDMVGGYSSGRSLYISGNVFAETESRMSYYINGVLIKNNLPLSNKQSDTISFDNYNSGSLSIDIYERYNYTSEVQFYLHSNEFLLLQSSDGDYLQGKDPRLFT